MPELIAGPHLIPVPGNKIIEEFVGRVNNRESQVSVARMRSPAGWSEPGQCPDFDEFTVVLNGGLHVEHDKGVLEVRAGQAVITRKGEWVRYSTPQRSEERRVGKSVDLGGRRIIKKKKEKTRVMKKKVEERFKV